ncbi:MAG: HAMP domain-containing protein [Anaerolineaceae bacterium]|jgi:NarL family two-component system sensor histidine kinase LiaS|nr:MAG: HAMP domain-containing protein [Anaerolineaceae bacterium]
MNFVKKAFSGIKWKLTITYMLATLLMLFMVEVLIAISGNRYAFTSINFVYSSAQSLSESNYALGLALEDPLDTDYLNSWIEFNKETFLRVTDRNDRNDRKDSPPPLEDDTFIDLTPKTIAFSASKSTLTIVNSEGIIVATNNPLVFPVGQSINLYLSDNEIAMLNSVAEAMIPAPQFSILEQDMTTLILPIRQDTEYCGAIFAQYYAPTFLEQLEAAISGFLPELPVFLLISSVIGSLFGFIIASSFTKRLDHMKETTLQWGLGDFSKKAEVHGNDEISTLAVSLNHMADQFQELLEKEQVLATMEERNRLARDLHDSVKQQIFAISMNLGAVKSLLKTDLKKAILQVEISSKLAQQALDELTTLINTLRPVQLGDQSLPVALRDYLKVWEKQSGVSVVFRVEGGEKTIAQEAEQSLFRVIQEALSNISRHSRASAASIFLTFGTDHLMLQISDNGIGFNKVSVKQGLGLHSMEERVKELNGTIKVNTSTSGTTITIIIPQKKMEQKNDDK